MHLYNGTGCLVFLVGSLTTMPNIAENNSETAILVTRQRHCYKETKEKIESYRVILNKMDATKITQFGFPGMTISIRGDLRGENKSDIIAEKIDFIDFPSSNQFDAVDHCYHLSQKEMTASEMINSPMSYWFTRDGSMRKEFTLVH